MEVKVETLKHFDDAETNSNIQQAVQNMNAVSSQDRGTKDIIEKIFTCLECGKGFGRNSHLKRHEKLHCSKELIVVRNSTSETLRQHMPLSNDNIVEAMVVQPDISVHESLTGKHTINRSFICVICGKGFGRNSHLKRHLKLHYNKESQVSTDQALPDESLEEDLNEPICFVNTSDEAFNDSSTETIPENLFEDGEDPIEPTFSHEVFHANEHEKSGEEGYHSSAGSENAESKVTDKAKINRNFICTICDKGFGCNSHLNRHMKLHIGGPTFDCEFCGKKFLQNGNMKAHVRMVHSQERSFKCTICSKMFLQHSNLKTHMRIHTGEKPYVCKICERGFSQVNQLKTHLRTHTGEKPFSCLICGKRFTNKRGQMKHELAHTQKSTKKKRQKKEVDQDGQKDTIKKLNLERKKQEKEKALLPVKCKEETDVVVKEEHDIDELATVIFTDCESKIDDVTIEN